MRIKSLIDEDFVNYKDPVMFIGTISCGGKCCTEAGIPLSVCQNDELRSAPVIDIPDKDIIERYMANGLTTGICFGGLEPFEQFEELDKFITALREDYDCHDTVIIYTGYEAEEIDDKLYALAKYDNIIVKLGRFIPDDEKHLDETLGVELASQNQFALTIS